MPTAAYARMPSRFFTRFIPLFRNTPFSTQRKKLLSRRNLSNASSPTLEPQAPLAQLGHGANSNRGAHASIARGHGESKRAKTHPFQFASTPPYDFFMTSVLHFGHTMRIVPLSRGMERICPHPLQRKYFVVLRLTYMVSSMFHQRFGFADAASHF